ncbi:MAG: Cthe_2314 family HEPN domain-containing protein [Carboxydocellales bacterium]
MYILDSLYETNLYKNVFEFSSIIIKKTYDNVTDLSNIPINLRKNLTKDEKYIMNVFYKLNKITGTCEQLFHVLIYLSHFPKTKIHLKNNITLANYLKYHIENHLIRITTILDQTALLINEIYFLGYPPSRCNVEAILENLNTKNTTSAKILKSFQKAVKGIKTHRNLIVHRGIYDDDDIDKLSSIHLIGKYNPEFVPPMFGSYCKLISKEKLNLLEKNSEAVIQFLVALYNSLDEVFISKYKELKNCSD